MDNRDLRDLQKKMEQFTQLPISFRSVGAVILILLAVPLLWSMWYTIDPEEVGVVLRFGRFDRRTPPGLHFKFPYPVETIEKVAVQRQLKEEFGFRTARPGSSPEPASGSLSTYLKVQCGSTTSRRFSQMSRSRLSRSTSQHSTRGTRKAEQFSRETWNTSVSKNSRTITRISSLLRPPTRATKSGKLT